MPAPARYSLAPRQEHAAWSPAVDPRWETEAEDSLNRGYRTALTRIYFWGSFALYVLSCFDHERNIRNLRILSNVFTYSQPRHG